MENGKIACMICMGLMCFSLASTVVSVFMTIFNFVRHKPPIVWIAIGLVAAICCSGLFYEIFVNDSSPINFMRGVDMDGH